MEICTILDKAQNITLFNRGILNYKGPSSIRRPGPAQKYTFQFVLEEIYVKTWEALRDV